MQVNFRKSVYVFKKGTSKTGSPMSGQVAWSKYGGPGKAADEVLPSCHLKQVAFMRPETTAMPPL